MPDIDINPALPTWPARRDPERRDSERGPRRDPEEPARTPAEEPAAEPTPPPHEEGEPGANVDEYARRCAP